MDKRVILAVAGAGKTYHICHALDGKERSLILAYTRENIHNINKELLSTGSYMPELTSVMTFDSFLYRCFVCPYEPTIAEFFGRDGFRSKGITTVDPPPQRINNYFNPKYKKKNELEHYITKENQYYCSTLSELVMYVSKGKDALLKRAAKRLNLFYGEVFIDEFQDFRGHDYELIVKLSKLLNRVILVGDYYQHSVSAINNSGKPFKEKNKDKEITYDEFVEKLRNIKFEVDDETLKKSRRCSEDVCNFVRDKLRINIESAGINLGKVYWVTEDKIKDIMEDSSIVKLVYSRANDYSFDAMNWSYSKGDTVDKACVVLTDKFENMDAEDFYVKGIPVSTINKLYVALTRSKGDLFLVKASIFRKYQKTI